MTMSDTQSNINTVKLVYILYLANLVVPFLSIIGVVVAYVNKDEAPAWLQSHYQFQIRTFWISLLYLFVGGILSIILIGWLVLLFWLVWMVVRCVKGIKYLDAQQTHPNPTGWLFS